MSNRKYWILALVTPCAIIIDQVTKSIAHKALEGGKIITLIPHYLNLLLVTNEGMVFGILNDSKGAWRSPLLIGISVVALFIIAHLFRQTKKNAVFLPLSLSLILAGAVGNFIDRIRWGYVVDFVNMHFRDHHWPTFNVADAAITCGIVILILDTIFGPGVVDQEETKKQVTEKAPPDKQAIEDTD